MRRFGAFACFDWSGEKTAKPRGIALGLAEETSGAGADAPALVVPEGGWSRQDALDWIEARIAERTDILIGCDFSFALPFADRGAYFPGWRRSPAEARSLWSCVEQLSADEPHLSASALADHSELSRHFRRHAAGKTSVGDRFEGGLGRLRITERACRAQKLGNAVSCFNLVGPAQVGKSSFSGMRLLDRLAGRIAIWPFDPVPETGPVLVEMYTALAARSTGLTGPTKLREPEALDRALEVLGSAPHAPLAAYDDHSTDALLGAAWLRRAAAVRALWAPPDLTPQLAAIEGWTFGVR